MTRPIPEFGPRPTRRSYTPVVAPPPPPTPPPPTPEELEARKNKKRNWVYHSGLGGGWRYYEAIQKRRLPKEKPEAQAQPEAQPEARRPRRSRASRPAKPLADCPLIVNGVLPPQPPGPEAAKRRNYQLQAAAGQLLPAYGVRLCNVVPMPGAGGVELRRHVEGGVSFGGLRHCGSPWVCPVCARKISERRTAQIRQALEVHRARGGVALFVTYTIPHLLKDRLLTLLEGFAEARRRLTKHRAYRKLLSDLGYVGNVYGLEIMYGRNGWHPHGHQLLLVTRADVERVRSVLFGLWADLVESLGLGVASPDAFSVEVVADNPDDVAAYVAKLGGVWGPAEELGRANVKRQRGGGAAPFELLRVWAESDTQAAEAIKLTPERAGMLFEEYAAATRARKALFGLTKLLQTLDLGDAQTDEELAAESGTDTELIGVIPLDDWSRVIRTGTRAEVLIEAQRNGWPGVLALLERIRAHLIGAPPPPEISTWALALDRRN